MSYLWILLAVSLAVCSMGWRFIVYFFSIGYGYGIAALAIASAVIFHNQITPSTIACCIVLFIFGCRLGTYLLLRERKAKGYRQILEDSKQRRPGFGESFVVWISCALLYVAQISPLAFRLGNSAEGGTVNELWAWIGAAVMLAGTLLEAIADAQKTKAKKVAPQRFVDTGLYRFVRCPNYLGEVTIWTGCLLLNIGIAATAWQWVISAIGYVGIIYVMFSGARRLEIRQENTYGEDPEYRAYVKRTPILIPFLPIYSVMKYKWLVA